MRGICMNSLKHLHQIYRRCSFSSYFLKQWFPTFCRNARCTIHRYVVASSPSGSEPNRQHEHFVGAWMSLTVILQRCVSLHVFMRIQTSESSFALVSQDYGGFLTLMMLKSTEKLIRCAAAQAPVIDWSMYGESSHSSALTAPLLSNTPQGRGNLYYFSRRSADYRHFCVFILQGVSSGWCDFNYPQVLLSGVRTYWSLGWKASFPGTSAEF